MRQPQGFIQDPGMVCKLNKSIYDLKQSAKVWNDTISKIFEKMRFTQCVTDKCLFSKNSKETQVYVILHVDYMLIASNSNQEIEKVKKELN